MSKKEPDNPALPEGALTESEIHAGLIVELRRPGDDFSMRLKILGEPYLRVGMYWVEVCDPNNPGLTVENKSLYELGVPDSAGRRSKNAYLTRAQP